MEPILTNQGASCLSAAAASGGLNLETDPYAAIVDVDAAAGGKLVAPGDEDSSVLYQRMAGLSGGIMPPGGALDGDLVAAVATWLDDGATSDGVGTTDTSTRWTDDDHPAGWADPSVHGVAMKLQTETDCRACHGDDLLGGTGPACESCHGAGWESNGLWCHGGEETPNGAPPRGPTTPRASRSTPSSLTPRTTRLTSAFADVACGACHDALTPGHVLDGPTGRHRRGGPGRWQLVRGGQQQRVLPPRRPDPRRRHPHRRPAHLFELPCRPLYPCPLEQHVGRPREAPARGLAVR